MIFEVVVVFSGVFFWNVDRVVMVGNIIWELIDSISFVFVGEMFFVVFVVDGDMFLVFFVEFFDSSFDVFYVVL